MQLKAFSGSSAPNPTKQLADVNADGNPVRDLRNANIVTLLVGQLLLEDSSTQETSCILTHQMMTKARKAPLLAEDGLWKDINGFAANTLIAGYLQTGQGSVIEGILEYCSFCYHNFREIT